MNSLTILNHHYSHITSIFFQYFTHSPISPFNKKPFLSRSSTELSLFDIFFQVRVWWSLLSLRIGPKFKVFQETLNSIGIFGDIKVLLTKDLEDGVKFDFIYHLNM